ncbi:2'-5' RNA ligase family protein [Erythrobacter sp. SCSIO 43205]|uniref:2'-5' RNA ligase family protein n=1 Tax=Erythrobacter sp. SCSIO 43205 TaxID=2779361 RepID=UPI001CA8E0C4|nr:2'-5' RNA ligase family protein [Erythrobacter sp. SCSIO 43205]UAB79192.1 2'-5' RNA ligase family protein [Erythrobacter sp. SCSIO 43205]
MAKPFIVTAALPPDIQRWADKLRCEHYPAERNYLHAHVTMFHSFAPSLFDELKDFLPQVTREFAPPKAFVTGIMDLGKGTAIALQSEPLLALRALIAEHFHGSLTAQDLYEPRPHITIQNKVTKNEARALQAKLAPTLEQRQFTFPALELHLYRDGPWEKIKSSVFRGKEELV